MLDGLTYLLYLLLEALDLLVELVLSGLYCLQTVLHLGVLKLEMHKHLLFLFKGQRHILGIVSHDLLGFLAELGQYLFCVGVTLGPALFSEVVHEVVDGLLVEFVLDGHLLTS